MEKFEKLWIEDRVNYEALHGLSDAEYICYKIWEDEHKADMYKKHYPNDRVLIGKNPNLIFHGGCLGCLSQRLHGVNRCLGCMYFRFHPSKNNNLFIEGETADVMTQKDIDDLFKS